MMYVFFLIKFTQKAVHQPKDQRKHIITHLLIFKVGYMTKRCLCTWKGNTFCGFDHEIQNLNLSCGTETFRSATVQQDHTSPLSYTQSKFPGIKKVQVKMP